MKPTARASNTLAVPKRSIIPSRLDNTHFHSCPRMSTYSPNDSRTRRCAGVVINDVTCRTVAHRRIQASLTTRRYAFDYRQLAHGLSNRDSNAEGTALHTAVH